MNFILSLALSPAVIVLFDPASAMSIVSRAALAYSAAANSPPPEIEVNIADISANEFQFSTISSVLPTDVAMPNRRA